MDAEGVDAGDDEGLRSVAAGLRLVLLGMVATVAVQVGFAVAAALFVQLDPAKDTAETLQKVRQATLLRSLNADHAAAATVLNGLVVLASVLGVAGARSSASGRPGVGEGVGLPGRHRSPATRWV